jgi:hypothetical protein
MKRLTGENSPILVLMILKIVKPKTFRKNICVFAQTIASCSKNLFIKLIFQEKRQFFRRHLAKIAEKNIDGWSPWLTTTFLHLALTNENGAFNKALGI